MPLEVSISVAVENVTKLNSEMDLWGRKKQEMRTLKNTIKPKRPYMRILASSEGVTFVAIFEQAAS